MATARRRKLDRAGVQKLIDELLAQDNIDKSMLFAFAETINVIQSSIHSEFHQWIGRKPCEPKDFLKFASEVKGDLFDSTSSKAMERFNTLAIKLTSLQKNYENNHLRYK